MPITKTLPYFFNFLFLGGKVMTMSEPNEYLQKIWNSKKKGATTNKQKNNSLFKKKKHILTLLFANIISCSVLIHFERFKKL
jgi:hypothetical protein